MSELARALQAEHDRDAMGAELVRSAVALIPGAQKGSLSVVTGRRQVTSLHPTGELPRQVDAVQDETGQGPCLDAAYEHETVRAPDLSTERRWPLFAARASALGVGSMVSFRLHVTQDDLGALNLMSRQPGAFDDESEHIGLVFASHAAVALAGNRAADQLNQALVNRDVIGQAKGILMERLKVTPDQAFAMLARISQNTNRKLGDVAAVLTHTGRVSGQPSPP